MCCKSKQKRRIRDLEKKQASLAKKQKKLSDEEERELENLRNDCGGGK
ncbi:MAG: hypothetical protein NTY75_01925 [Candidatus Shapirobacteria bacterium]|nr:hypothetical protein [Candidatus Shapirobacteria bacterium]